MASADGRRGVRESPLSPLTESSHDPPDGSRPKVQAPAAADCLRGFHRGQGALTNPDAIVVWRACLGRGAPPSADLSLLSVEERARAARFRFAKDRELYVLGKRMTRSLLARGLGLCPRSLVFHTKTRGKPELAGGPARSGLTFNLAHSGAHVFVALARNRRLGVDVQHERPDLDLLGLARRFFCAGEIGRLAAGPADETRRLFYKYWTLKEAYLKAEGSGLGIDLTAIDASDVTDECLAAPAVPGEDTPRGIRVQRLPAPSGYAAAVASDAATWTVQLRDWQPEAVTQCAGVMRNAMEA